MTCSKKAMEHMNADICAGAKMIWSSRTRTSVDGRTFAITARADEGDDVWARDGRRGGSLIRARRPYHRVTIGPKMTVCVGCVSVAETEKKEDKADVGGVKKFNEGLGGGRTKRLTSAVGYSSEGPAKVMVSPPPSLDALLRYQVAGSEENLQKKIRRAGFIKKKKRKIAVRCKSPVCRSLRRGMQRESDEGDATGEGREAHTAVEMDDMRIGRRTI